MPRTTLEICGAVLAGVALGCHAAVPSSAPAIAAPSPVAMPVRVRFAAMVADQPFTCGRSYPGIGTTASTITPSDFRLFVYNVQLLRADGSTVPVALDQDDTWQYRTVALLDFEDGSGPCRNGTAALHTEIRGTAPAGPYKGLRFTIGLPFELNHADPTLAPSPLNLTAMFWVWQAGYRFVKIDLATTGQPAAPPAPPAPPGAPQGMARASGFPVHIGSAGCASASKTTPPTSCKFPNEPIVTLDGFDLERDTVVADLATLLETSNVDINTPNTAPGCMAEPDDPDCVGVVRMLGLAGEPQRVFTRRADPHAFAWDLPAWVPAPSVPDDNPMTIAKVALGRRLFYDPRLSVDETLSCASCHQQARGFSDGRARPLGVHATPGVRNAMALANVAYQPVLTWANPGQRRLETQLLVPLLGEAPVELGMLGSEQVLFDRLARVPLYQRLFEAAFPERGGRIDLETIVKAIACFERTLLSFDSPYDRYKHGSDEQAIPDSAKRGEALFYGERMECSHCHGGTFFTDNVQHAKLKFPEVAFHNTGLYNLDGRGAYPADNHGIREVTADPDDEGRFRTPALRNVAVTAPYMHDGSIATLEDVIRRHYAVRGFATSGGAAPSPLRDSLIDGFDISDDELADLVAFLRSLTDEHFLRDPRFADPW